MSIKVTLWEQDQVTGQMSANALREYPLATVDTVRHALTLAGEQERDLEELFQGFPGYDARVVDGFKRFSYRMVDAGHPLGYGNVWRTVWVSVSVRN